MNSHDNMKSGLIQIAEYGDATAEGNDSNKFYYSSIHKCYVLTIIAMSNYRESRNRLYRE